MDQKEMQITLLPVGNNHFNLVVGKDIIQWVQDSKQTRDRADYSTATHDDQPARHRLVPVDREGNTHKNGGVQSMGNIIPTERTELMQEKGNCEGERN